MAKKKMDCKTFKCKSGYDYLCCDFCYRVSCEDRCLNNHRICKLAIECDGGKQAVKKVEGENE